MSQSTVNLLAHLDRNAHTNAEALLRQACLYLVELHPTIHDVITYRLSRDRLTYWFSHADSAAAAVLQLADQPIIEQAVRSGKLTPDDTHNRLLVPLRLSNEVTHLLIVRFKSAVDDEELFDAIADFARQLTLILENQQLQHLLQQQMATTAQLAAAESFEDVALILAQHMLNQQQFITINRFEYDEDGKLSGAYVITSANRERSFTGQTPIHINLNYLQRIHDALLRDGEILIHDEDHDPDIQDSDREWLKSLNVHSMYTVPLQQDVRNTRLSVFVSIIDTAQALAPTSNEKQIYHNIAEQAANAIAQHRLIEQTESSLHESQVLYDLIADLIATEQPEEILYVLNRHLGPNIRTINHTEIRYHADGKLKEILITHQWRDGAVTQIDEPMHEYYSASELIELRRYWDKFENRLEVMEDLTDESHTFPMREQLVAAGIGSAIRIPIWENGQRTRQIGISWSQPRAFSQELLQILETAQSQIRLILLNQDLLRRAQASAAQSQEQARTLRLLNALTTDSNSVPDEQTLLNKALQTLVEATGMDHISIMTIDASGTQTTLVCEYPPGEDVGKSSPITQASLPARLQKSAVPVFIPNVATSELLTQETKIVLKKAGIQACAFLPMIDQDNQMLGVVGLELSRAVEAFDAAIIDIAQTIVAQIGINLQRIRLLNDTQQQVAQMQYLTTFSQLIQSSLQMPDILNVVLKNLPEILPSHYIGVYLYDRRADTLQLVAQYRNAENTIHIPGQTVNRSDNSIVWQAWQEQSFVQIADLKSDWEWQHPAEHDLQTMMATPLATRGLSLGIIEVGHQSPGAYRPLDMAAFQQLSNQIAVTISNAEAYAESQRLARNKALANEIIGEIQQQTDMVNILAVTVRELGKALGANTARIRLRADIPETSGENV